jgi:cyclopropane-fatty-acyl-phospholipid synthase
MTLLSQVACIVERTPLPDFLTAAGIDFLVGRKRRKLASLPDAREAAFAAQMFNYPIAIHTEEANAQHYELPPEFFGLVLGPRRKYSCCRYPHAATGLAEAEEIALEETLTHAGVSDGQNILELGCGWGSLTLYMAERLPNARIVAVSNSRSQRRYIEAAAKMRGLTNLMVLTADMNGFDIEETFDRIVSVEMFEHMSNWSSLFAKARGWLKPEGWLFMHVFTHRSHSYRFDHTAKTDWIAQHFFTGGIMPGERLAHQFPSLFTVEDTWRWSGTDYQRTAWDWLANFDANSKEISVILQRVYGRDAALWKRRWRLFFLATAGLFGHADGQEWGIGHYCLAPVLTR